MANDEQQPTPLITDRERATGEFAAITTQADQEWKRHYDTCQFFCQQRNICAEGARLLARTSKGGEA